MKLIKIKFLLWYPQKIRKKWGNVVCNAGAGIIGEYCYCTTCVKSLGTFISNDMPRTSRNGHLYTIVEDSLVKYKETTKNKNARLIK